MTSQVIPWREIESLPDVDSGLPSLLATVDTLRGAWEEVLTRMPRQEFQDAQRRNLRRHAIETGIIERLYDVDWGVTEALVAEGLSAEVAAREGGIDENALRTIQTQFEALEFLAGEVRDGRDLSLHFIRQLHQLITRNQPTYEGRNELGQVVQVPLRRGDWKLRPNHVHRPDGSLLEYVPPEQVQSQMERLVDLYAQTGGHHPVVRAAWLHHRFIQIHPFEDGNGRVARALTLLVLLQQRYAPLVVDRRNREDYLRALDAANDGDLAPLVRLFAHLETVAIGSELERPVRPAAEPSAAAGVARAHSERFKTLRAADAEKNAEAAEALAAAVHERLNNRLEMLGQELADAFRDIDPEVRAWTDSAAPRSERAMWWKHQLIRAAREVGFFTNLSRGSWWVRLQITVLGETLRYIAAVQKVGHGETGFLAVTVVAEVLHPGSDDKSALPEPLLELSPTDGVTLAYNNDVEERWQAIEEVLDSTLSAAVDRFAQRLG